MKKIIIILSVLLSLCSINVIHAIGDDCTLVLNNYVVGVRGSTIETQYVEITLDDPTQFFFNLNVLYDMIDEEVTDWFTNIPDKCNYTAFIDDVDENTLTIRFSGSIDLTASPLTQNISLELPSDEGYILLGSNPYENDCLVDNTNAKYVVLDVFNIEYRGPYVVKGTVNEDLETYIVEVEVIGDKFKSDSIGTILPTVNGLTPTITYVDEVNNYCTISYSGKPIDPSQDLIHTTIPKECLTYSTIDRLVPDRDDVKFNIVPKPTPEVEPVVIPEEPITYKIPVTGVN